MKNSVVDVEHVSFQIGDKLILDDVSFNVCEGEYLSIIGPNGAGKTTLLKLVANILKNQTGDISICGKRLTAYDQKTLAKLISYVPQGAGALFPFTVYEFVMMGRYPHLSSFTPISSDDKDAVDKALALTDTSEFAKHNVNTLSGGERQKVFIAAALAQGASIMLLDEPTTFLDPRRQAEIGAILKNINRESGITIVSVTHDINSAISSSDKLIALKNGQLVFSGSPAELMSQGRLEDIFDISFLFANHPGRNLPVLFLE